MCLSQDLYTEMKKRQRVKHPYVYLTGLLQVTQCLTRTPLFPSNYLTRTHLKLLGDKLCLWCRHTITLACADKSKASRNSHFSCNEMVSAACRFVQTCTVLRSSFIQSNHQEYICLHLRICTVAAICTVSCLFCSSVKSSSTLPLEISMLSTVQ